MKKLALLLASVMLLGAGCATNADIEAPTENSSEDAVNVVTTGNIYEGYVKSEAKEIPVNTFDYYPVYKSFVEENKGLFEDGVMLVDINGDTVPELFGVEKDEDKIYADFCQLKDGKVSLPDEKNERIALGYLYGMENEYMDEYWNQTSYSAYESLNMYTHRLTGKRMLIYNEAYNYKEISYDDESYYVGNIGISDSDNIKQVIDNIMIEYEPVHNALHVELTDKETDSMKAFEKAVKSFSENEAVKYDRAEDGDFTADVYTVDYDTREVEMWIYPHVSDEDIKKGSVIIDGVKYYINYEPLNLSDGYIYDDDENIIAYMENHCVINKDMAKRVKVKMENDLKVKYDPMVQNDYADDDSEYDEDGNYKRLNEYDAIKFFAHYNELKWGSCFRGTIKDGKITYLYSMYCP